MGQTTECGRQGLKYILLGPLQSLPIPALDNVVSTSMPLLHSGS